MNLTPSHSERKTRAAVYARGSTAAQDSDPQLRALREYVQRFGWTLAGEYADTGSGIDDGRPQLARLMADAFAHRFDAVVVWKFDRFGRSLTHLLRSLEEFHRHGIEFVSIQEKLDTGSPMGKAVFSFLGALGEFERDMLSGRVRLGIQAARAAGKHLGRYADPLDENRIRADYAALRSIRKTALMHRVSKSTVNRIVRFQRKILATNSNR